MSSTEATPLMRGRGSGPRTPSEREEEGEGGGRSQGSQAHRPRSWTSDRVLLALLGFGVAITAGFISTTQTIERFQQQPSLQQKQAGGGAGAGAGGSGSRAKNLARTVHKNDEPPPALVSMFSRGQELVTAQQQQQQQDNISRPPGDIAASAPGGGAAATLNGPDSGSTGHGLGGEDRMAVVDVDIGMANGVGEGEAQGNGAVFSDELGARAGGGWRSTGDRKKTVASRLTGFADAVEGGGGLGGLGETAPFVSAGADSGRKPNVFFLLIDDMGYGDIGYQSTDLPSMTPNLNALMSGGRKLSNYYSMSVCTPARASLMTGRYPVRYGMQYGIISPGEPWGLSLSEKVLPEYMNEAGYESHMIGKWHLGSYNDESIPSRRGFKTYLGYLNGEEEYYSHLDIETMEDGVEFYDFGFGNETGYYDVTKVEDGVPCSELEGSEERVAWKEEEEQDAVRDPADACYIGTYSTDAFVGRAMEVIKEKTPWDEEPLFLYLAYQSVHSPVGPTPKEAFTKEEQLLLDAVQDETKSDLRALFAEVLLYLDKRIGQLMDLLEAEGWLENSIIVVASDNGGCPFWGGGCNYPLKGSKKSMYEGGTKVPGLIWSKSHLPESLWGTSYDYMMHATDWVPTLVSAAGGEVTGSAGALDGIDHWDSLTSVAVEGTGDSGDGPRTEMLYNWDAYLLSSADTLTENLDLVQGAFRQGSWKLLVNVWCSGYYSFDQSVLKSDATIDAQVTCSTTLLCNDCGDVCEEDPRYGYGDFLVNLDDDPREERNVLQEYPEIAARLRKRAEEVVFSEYAKSAYTEVNPESYDFWKAHGWWMAPWFGKLDSDLSVERHI